MNKKVFILVVILGFLIWVLSPYIAGTKSAWNANFYYLPAVFIVGLISGFLAPRSFGRSFLAMYIGQFLGLLSFALTAPHSKSVFGDPNFVIFVGSFFMLFFSALGLIGVFVGTMLKRIISKEKSEPRPNNNYKTLLFILIGLVVLWYLASGGYSFLRQLF